MADSQSRYSIMDQLNNRKLEAKKLLAKIETETEERVYQTEKLNNQTKIDIKNREDSYVQDFKDNERELKVRINMLKSDFERNQKKLQAQLDELSNNYKSDFESWKAEQLADIASSEQGIERYKKVQDAVIAEKTEIIAEIEKSIEDLKEMSKETVKA